MPKKLKPNKKPPNEPKREMPITIAVDFTKFFVTELLIIIKKYYIIFLYMSIDYNFCACKFGDSCEPIGVEDGM